MFKDDHRLAFGDHTPSAVQDLILRTLNIDLDQRNALAGGNYGIESLKVNFDLLDIRIAAIISSALDATVVGACDVVLKRRAADGIRERTIVHRDVALSAISASQECRVIRQRLEAVMFAVGGMRKHDIENLSAMTSDIDSDRIFLKRFCDNPSSQTVISIAFRRTSNQPI